MSIERINLRLNLEDPIDKVIWEFVKDKKKKSTFVKKVLYDLAAGTLTNELAIDTEISENEFLVSKKDVDDIEGF